MKILLPTSSPSDLAFSFVAAAILHVAALGFGLGYLDRPPLPMIKPSQVCETISFLPKGQVQQERKEPLDRERVEKTTTHREVAANASRTVKIAERRLKSPLPPESREKENKTQRVPEKIQREKAPHKAKEKAPKPEDRWLKSQGAKDIAISRAAEPRVDRGFAFQYPRLARRYGYEGRVELKVAVSPKGLVVKVEIHKSSGYGILDESAAQQMKSVPFQPALSKSGMPLPSEIVLGVNFILEDEKAQPDFF